MKQHIPQSQVTNIGSLSTRSNGQHITNGVMGQKNNISAIPEEDGAEMTYTDENYK